MPYGSGADGHGTRIDRINGVVWWSFRGGCSFCGCEENETNMTIINNMGSSGCTEHYEDGYYIGCW